jgi:hypothetical protein
MIEPKVIERVTHQKVIDQPLNQPGTNRGNPLIIFLALLLSIVVFGSFIAWWHEFAVGRYTVTFQLFVWSLVASDIFLLITRALREWANNR